MFFRLYKVFDPAEDILYNCNKNEVISNIAGIPINLSRMNEFLNNMERGKPDAIRTITIGIEGDPTIYHIFYDGEKILAVYDTTNYIGGGAEILIYEGDSINTVDIEDRTEYVLMKDDSPVQIIYYYSETFMKGGRRSFKDI